jgi:hypothetical protein
MTAKTYNASCACGSLSYRFTTEVVPEQWRVRKCTCSFCSKQENHIHVSDPSGQVSYEISRPENLSRLRFGTKTADFITCSNCAAYLGAVMNSEAGMFAVLNADLIGERLNLPVAPCVSFDGEDLDARLDRRNAGWTPVVGDQLTVD